MNQVSGYQKDTRLFFCLAFLFNLLLIFQELFYIRAVLHHPSLRTVLEEECSIPEDNYLNMCELLTRRC